MEDATLLHVIIVHIMESYFLVQSQAERKKEREKERESQLSKTSQESETDLLFSIEFAFASNTRQCASSKHRFFARNDSK